MQFKPFPKLGTELFVTLSLATPAIAAPCDDNFTTSGNIFTGKTFKTWTELPNSKFESAYRGAYMYTVKDGWKVLQTDKEMGLIAAAQAASFAKGQTVPLNIAVERTEGGAKVSITFSTPAGMGSSEDAVKSHLCKTIAAAEAQQDGPSDVAAPTQINRKPNHKGHLNLLPISPTQQDRIAKEVEKRVQDPKLQALIGDAAPTIKEFVGLVSCMPAYLNFGSIRNMLAIYATPGNNLLIPQPPANQTPYHDKSACLSVTRIQGWQAPALNAIRFEVVYQAEDSGESTKSNHEVVKQPDGVWLFNK